MPKIHLILAIAASIGVGLGGLLATPPLTARAQTLPSCAWAPDAPPVCATSISGPVMWSDHSPARSVIIDLVPDPPGVQPGVYLADADSMVRARTDITGRYE